MTYIPELHLFEPEGERIAFVPLAGGVRDGSGGRIVALGTFDGLHIGHAAILRETLRLAAETGLEPAVFCVLCPPDCSVGGKGGSSLSSEADTLAGFASFGIRAAYLSALPDLCGVTAEEFIRDVLIGRLGAAGVVCGFNFTFGRGRTGTFGMLREAFGDLAVRLPAVTVGGEPVSSSRIRALIADGRVEDVLPLLGRYYSVCLPVVSGRRDGRKLGFPTANQRVPHAHTLPPQGVYVTVSHTDDGRAWPSVTDVGTAPTLDQSRVPRLETHLLDAPEGIDLYGRFLTVEFRKRLRGELRFPDAAALAAQIARDVADARQYFAEEK